MFDRYNLSAGPSSMSATINVKENKAPTDDSIRLLSEMQEKVKLSLIKQYYIDDNTVKGRVYYFRDMVTDEYVVDIYFTINGTEFHSSKRLKQNYIENEAEAAHRLTECMSVAILNALSINIKEF